MRYTDATTTAEIIASLAAGVRVSFSSHLYLIKPKRSSKETHGYWRFDYKFEGRNKTISLGVYPAISIDLAKNRESMSLAYLALGLDPSPERKKITSKDDFEDTYDSSYDLINPRCFEAVALRWANNPLKKVAAKTTKNKISRIKNHLIPNLGNKLLDDITPQDIYSILENLAKKTPYTARRVMRICNHVFDYGVSNGCATRNPCQSPLNLTPRVTEENFPAITAPDELAEVLQRIHEYKGTFVVKCALKLLPLLLIRPGNLRTAEWNEFDLVNRLWLIPAHKMKSSQQAKEEDLPHVVPLSTQAVEILQQLYDATEGKLEDKDKTGKLFPSCRKNGKFMSDGTINKALRSLGICTKTQLTGHGFRAVARTMIQERLHINSYLIEIQLDHTVKNKDGAPYNRASEVEMRDLMMQIWSDFLTDLRLGKIKIVNKIKTFIPITERMKMSVSDEKMKTATATSNSEKSSAHTSIATSSAHQSKNPGLYDSVQTNPPALYIEGLHRKPLVVSPRHCHENGSVNTQADMFVSPTVRSSLDNLIHTGAPDERIPHILQNRTTPSVELMCWNEFARSHEFLRLAIPS